MNPDIVVPSAFAFLIGIVAGMRAMTAPAAIAWGARLGKLSLSGTWLAFLGYAWTPWILTLLAAVELVTDQLPTTPSRTVPVQFGTRILMGGVCGAALTAGAGTMLPGAIVGIAGAVAGTLGGRAFRARMAAAFGSDRPGALLEDVIAIGLAVAVVLAAR
jgi:uncharacterized membrane protein